MLAPLLLALFCAPRPAAAWTELRSADGRALRLTADNPWTDQPYLPLAGNPSNAWGVDHQALQDATLAALFRWRRASGNAFTFDYWQGDDDWAYPRRLKRDGLSTVFFASGADGADDETGPQDLTGAAWTEVWYDDLTGEIVEVDILLNDLLFDFSGEQVDVGSGVLERTPLGLDDVLTHELGHALGLDHAATADSTMLPWIWPGQARLGCDDVVGIRQVYGTTDLDTAELSGTLSMEGGEGVAPQVIALSVEDGLVRAATMAEAGQYWLTGLPAGRYLVLGEPFLAGRESLGEGYAGEDLQRCDDGSVPTRAFLADEEGQPRVVDAAAGRSLTLPAFTLPCGQAVAQAQAGETPTDAPEVALDAAGRGLWLGQLEGAPALRYLSLGPLEGALLIDILAPGLYSSARVSPTLLDSQGQPVAAQVASPRAVQASGYTSWDSRLQAVDLAADDYVLELELTSMPASELPGGEVLQDAEPFAVVLVWTGPELDQPAPAADVWQGSCWQDERFEDYTSPQGLPLRREVPGGCTQSDPASSAVRSLGLLGLLGLRRRRRS